MVQSSEFKADVEDDALGKVYVVSTLHFFWIKADVLALTDEDWHAFKGNFYIVIPFPPSNRSPVKKSIHMPFGR